MFLKNIYKIIGIYFWVAMPCVVFAEATVKGIFTTMTEIVGSIIPVLMALVVAVFIWGIVKFVGSAGSLEKKKEAKNLIVWGLVGVFVLVAFWGLISLLLNTFFGSSSPPAPPSNWPPKAFP
ncbi:MAG: hypothetical protein K9M15_01035 [Candidatus Marinimicrobia bacterium]|nr:hypothetical protein [Candidatus Neomarinimicrobiota bacterium]